MGQAAAAAAASPSHLLFAFHDKIAVRKCLSDHGGHVREQGFLAIHRALAIAARCGICRKDFTRHQFGGVAGEQLAADEIRDTRIFLVRSASAGLVLEFGVVFHSIFIGLTLATDEAFTILFIVM